ICPDGTSIPARNLALMFALAAGSWWLIYVVIAGLWPHNALTPAAPVAVTDVQGPRVAGVAEGPLAGSPSAGAKHATSGKPSDPSLAMPQWQWVASLN